jgi:poly(hydroxyalkanoate) granule-associated protein
MAESKAAGGIGIGIRLQDIQKTLSRIQKEGERMLGRLRKDATDLLKKDRRKAVGDLVSQAKKLRTDLQKRAERAVKDLEDRSQRVVKIIEKQAERGVEPIIRGLNLPTRDELDTVTTRLAQLEKRLDELSEQRKESKEGKAA